MYISKGSFQKSLMCAVCLFMVVQYLLGLVIERGLSILFAVFVCTITIEFYTGYLEERQRSTSREERRAKRLLDQQENMGNRILNSMKKAAKENRLRKIWVERIPNKKVYTIFTQCDNPIGTHFGETIAITSIDLTKKNPILVDVRQNPASEYSRYTYSADKIDDAMNFLTKYLVAFSSNE